MNTKQCMACKEDILAEALKCKHCQQIQTKAANLQNKPAFNYLVIAMLGAFIVWIFYYIISMSIKEPTKPTFEISSAEFLLTESERGLNIRCIGEIKNPTLKRWDDFSLQAEFKNAEGKVIDVLYSEPQVTIYPQFSFSGMVSGDASASNAEYDSCELVVVNAFDY
ncbi:hypothetical protein M0C34_12270 [Agarivorans sp. TSD2052]|uniref:hypothetical protein n=1 Tax=Agarivorans sp. TSD2052 TaxID=2937286 RepID=UPI00200E031A|nr:hypothetical protein [Agarivorans sp. TSD2052]UPW17022.1 hypothetical protein M0C34_12270 [Agarivorans sp. TSD2052]